MIAQLAALAVAFVAIVASAMLLLRWGRAADTTLDGHVETALKLARARHPASRCPVCGDRVAGPAREHLCDGGAE